MSWSCVKAEMEEIAALYGLGSVIGYEGITKGIMNSNYLVKTEKGKYIFRILEMERDIEEEKKELKYLEYLGENGIPCPGVVLKLKWKRLLLFMG